jgi:hypothetical protein
MPRARDPVPSRPVPDPPIVPQGSDARPDVQETLRLVPTDTAPSKPTPTETVFGAYVAGWRSRSRGNRPPVLTDARRKLIATRLREFAPDVLAAACRGIWLSQWHFENGQTSIELALRNAGQVEKFAATSGPATRPTTTSAEQLRAEYAARKAE